MRQCRKSTLLLVALSLLTLVLVLLLQQSQENTTVPESPRHRAFATILTDETELELDAVRTLMWQIRHQHSRHTEPSTVVVIVPSSLSSYRRQLLEEEGAKLVPLPEEKWRHQAPHGESSLAPLHVFEQTEYERVLFLQPYTLLLRPLDAVWADRAAAQIQRRRFKSTIPVAVAADHSPDERRELPLTYGFASVSSGRQNPSPGFWLARPDPALVGHVKFLIDQHQMYRNASLRDVLNFVYRPDGDMPWTRLSTALWNCDVSSQQSIPPSCATVYIDLDAVKNPGAVNPDFLKLWWETQNRMRIFWKAEHEKGRK